MRRDAIDHWLQHHVNDFCAQTGFKEVRLASLADLLYALDPERADAVMTKYAGDAVLRPAPTLADLPRSYNVIVRTSKEE